jgi:hypothetical protein
MGRLITAASLIMLGLAGIARAQLSAPNKAGVAMGHLHYHVRDVAANKKFWVALGARPTLLGTTEVIPRGECSITSVSRSEASTRSAGDSKRSA